MKISSILIIAGFTGVALAVIIFVGTFYPVISVELDYQINAAQGQLMIKREIIPFDANFGIVIPRIGANAKIIPDVDPYNDKEYQVALTKGVAHALGTSLPGYAGNVFLFSHSSVNFYEAQRYNSVFYLLSKLEKGDEIDLYYKGEKFIYKVTGKIITDPKDLSYLTKKTDKSMVTLMTCWPQGTTFKRLIITAEI